MANDLQTFAETLPAYQTCHTCHQLLYEQWTLKIILAKLAQLASAYHHLSQFQLNINYFFSKGGGSSCTNDSTYAVGPWLGSGAQFTVVDTPGFQDSDEVSTILND